MGFVIYWHESAIDVHVSPSWPPLPPSSPSHPSGSSQCTGLECPVSCIKPGLASKHLLIAWLQSPSAVIWGSRATQTEPAVFYRIQSKQSLLWPSPGCQCFRSICELHQPPASSHCYLPLLPACSDPRNQIPIKSSILDTTPFIIHGLCLPNSVEREMT